MASIAAAGWDTIDTCDPAVSVIVEPLAPPCCVVWQGYDTVLGSDHGPTRYGLPGGRLCPRGVGAERDRTLTRDDQPPVRLGEVLREGIVVHHANRTVAARAKWPEVAKERLFTLSGRTFRRQTNGGSA
jgi:hypothetical protein